MRRKAPAQLKKSLSELDKIQQTIQHRRQIGDFYHQELPRLNFKTVPESSKTETVFLRYPVRVGNKEALLKKAQKQGIELGTWFETPLHGNEAPLSVFAYETGSCPKRACEQVVNLPTHIGVDKVYAEKVLNFLRTYADIL
jgi:dTDP-4-amino-4,6-dideoxygalactose transaminase